MAEENKYGVIVRVYNTLGVGHVGLNIYEAKNGNIISLYDFDNKTLKLNKLFCGSIKDLEDMIKEAVSYGVKVVSIDNIELSKEAFDQMLNKAKEPLKYDFVVNNCNTNARLILKASLGDTNFTNGSLIKKILKRIPVLDSTRADIISAVRTNECNRERG